MEFSSSLSILDSQNQLLIEKRILLLQAIERVGSISKAAREVPMSYKAAWDAIDAINNLSTTPVVSKETGGKGGGGAKLTPYGKNLIKTYLLVKDEHQRFLEHLTKMTDFNTGALKSIQRIAMQISARNQISGIIEHIDKGKVNASVFVKIKSGYTLVSVITLNGVNNLDLKVGDEVVCIFKSSSVLLTTDSTISVSARNKLQGKITKISIGEINSEIELDVGGNIVVAVITTEALNSLDVTGGDMLGAIIKASDVMLGK